MAELLTSERHPDGVWHARYPTGTLTLCGLVVLATGQAGRRRVPTCGACSRAGRLFDGIDGSMPQFWKPEAMEVGDDDRAA